MTVKIGGYTFQGWYMYTSILPETEGLYAIGPTISSALKKDETLKLIDVGESSNIRERVKNHDRKICWRAHARAIRYAYLSTPGKSKSEREAILLKAQLVEERRVKKEDDFQKAVDKALDERLGENQEA